jgi:hypothetical protein
VQAAARGVTAQCRLRSDGAPGRRAAADGEEEEEDARRGSGREAAGTAVAMAVADVASTRMMGASVAMKLCGLRAPSRISLRFWSTRHDHTRRAAPEPVGGPLDLDGPCSFFYGSI